MSNGPGLTGDRNFQTSCEVFIRGFDTRHIVYGVTRAELLGDEALLVRVLLSRGGAAKMPPDWEDDVVVTERRLKMGLGPAWVRAARRYDEYGERVYPASAKASRRGVNQRKGHDGRA